MKPLFVDTSGWIAYLSRRDEYHARATEMLADPTRRLLTTAWILVELGSFLAASSDRRRFASFVRDLQKNSRVIILQADAMSFDSGLELFRRRMDKEWSLVDCISFITMQERGLVDAVTADHHFQQAGYNVLLLGRFQCDLFIPPSTCAAGRPAGQTRG